MPSSTSPPTSLAICRAPSAPAPAWMPRSLRTSARPAGPAGAAVLAAGPVAVLAAGRVAAVRVTARVAGTGAVGMASVTVAVARARVATRGMPLAAPPRRTRALLVVRPVLVTALGQGRGLGRISRVGSAVAVAPGAAKARTPQVHASAAVPVAPATSATTRAPRHRGRGRTSARTPAGRTQGQDRADTLTPATAPLPAVPVGGVDVVRTPATLSLPRLSSLVRPAQGNWPSPPRRKRRPHSVDRQPVRDENVTHASAGRRRARTAQPAQAADAPRLLSLRRPPTRPDCSACPSGTPPCGGSCCGFVADVSARKPV